MLPPPLPQWISALSALLAGCATFASILLPLLPAACPQPIVCKQRARSALPSFGLQWTHGNSLQELTVLLAHACWPSCMCITNADAACCHRYHDESECSPHHCRADLAEVNVHDWIQLRDT
eukprot:4777621-Alexandrium_andersonii.AAC.1